MGQVLRITHNDIDYSFKILNEEPLSRETAEIAGFVNDTTLTLVRMNVPGCPKKKTRWRRSKAGR